MGRHPEAVPSWVRRSANRCLGPVHEVHVALYRRAPRWTGPCPDTYDLGTSVSKPARKATALRSTPTVAVVPAAVASGCAPGSKARSSSRGSPANDQVPGASAQTQYRLSSLPRISCTSDTATTGRGRAFARIDRVYMTVARVGVEPCAAEVTAALASCNFTDRGILPRWRLGLRFPHQVWQALLSESSERPRALPTW